VLLVASCDTAWIDYPTDPVKESLGELLLRSENAGSIAVWAPIAGTSSFEHRFRVSDVFTMGCITLTNDESVR
jgi:hypothetical protein